MEQSPRDLDKFDSKLPAGHAYVIRTSTRLTSYAKRHQRKSAMDITPQDVIDTLNAAGVKNWVLMGLHGYVGYIPDPRATQAVDVMVPYSARDKKEQDAVDFRRLAGQPRSHSDGRFAPPGGACLGRRCG